MTLSLQNVSPQPSPSIRDLVNIYGVSEQIIVSDDVPLTPSALLSESELVIRGVVRGRNDRLSSDGQTVVTDYTVEVVEAIHPQNGWKVQDVITVRRRGGIVNISGRTFVSRESEFPPFNLSEEYFLFLRSSESAVHHIVGGAQGAYRISHGTVPMFTGRATDPEVPVTEFTRGVRAELERHGSR